MPSDINETIAEVLRLDAKATPGPWVRTRTGATMAVAGCGGSRGGVYTLAESAYPSMSADLIAYYRTAAPVLAREVQRLQAELLTAHRTWAERCSAWSDSVEEAEAQRDAAYRAGQEAMRERCAALCDDWEAINYCDDWMAMELGAQQCAEAIRALEVHCAEAIEAGGEP